MKKTLVVTLFTFVAFVSVAGAESKIQPSANYGEGPSKTLDLRYFVGFEDLDAMDFPKKRRVGSNGAVYDPRQIYKYEIIVGEFWEVHCPEYPAGAHEGTKIKLSPHTMEITIYWKGGLVVKDVEQLKNVCSVTEGTVTVHQKIKAPFAFEVQMGTKSTRYAHSIVAYNDNGDVAKLLEEGRTYLIIDKVKYIRFIPQHVGEVKSLGKNPEIKINNAGRMGVEMDRLYYNWHIPTGWEVQTKTGVKKEGWIEPSDGKVTIYGPAVYVPAPAPAPSPTPTPTPAPQPLPDSNGNGGDGGGGGCDSGMGASALLLVPFFKRGRRS